MTKIIKIEGMMCGHCTARVEKMLSAIDGVDSVKASVENKEAIVEMSKEISEDIIRKTIEDCGFSVV